MDFVSAKLPEAAFAANAARTTELLSHAPYPKLLNANILNGILVPSGHSFTTYVVYSYEYVIFFLPRTNCNSIVTTD